MAASSQDLTALTAEVAQLAEAVRGMAQREIAIKALFEAGYQAGRDDVWGPAPGRPAVVPAAAAAALSEPQGAVT